MSAQDEVVLRIRSIMETGDVRSAVKEIEGYFEKMNLSKSMKGEFDGIFNELLKEVDNFEEKSQSSFKKASDVSALEKSAGKIENLFGKIIQNMSKLDGMDIEDLINIDTSEIKKISDEIEKLEKKIKGLTSQKLDFGADAFKGISKSGQIEAFFKNFESGKIDQAGVSLKALQQNVLAFGTSIQGSAADVKKAEEAMQRYAEALQSGDFDKIRTAILNLDQALQQTGDTSNLTKFVNKVNDMTQAWAETKDEVKQTTAEISRLETQKVDAAADAAARAAQQWTEMKTSVKGTSENVRDYTSATVSAASRTNELNREMDEIKNRVKYFLSLENAVDLFRRGVQKAFETVKELDKAMTETAVVTNFSVGDMWDQLPEYSKMAKELGVSMQGVYEASTLYYQQGLKTEEVMALTNETLKMARIAGLDCAEATDLMTAALRGFNMEINEASAQRVNDIYSELAAITAADTNEIATAMTKTASIANSANMELETTAALLAQMIETTREPAETAGTAMKTIIARFTEMKKATSDIINVDGEEVNVNKVEAALKSAGVALRDSTGQFRDLDDVFLDLSKRWNSLDLMTQRYIATTAAGSRQQSRFIAMMQDYDRTMELVDAAYDSAGSSSAQFAKTQDSLETKVNNLKTAWQEFLMGIANSDAIKFIIDTLTELLNTLNSATNGVSGFSTFIMKMFTIITTFKIGKGIFNKIFAGLGSSFLKGGTEAGQQMGRGIKIGIESSLQKESKNIGKTIMSKLGSIFASKKLIPKIPMRFEFDKDGKTSLKNFGEQLAKGLDLSQFKNSIGSIGSTLHSSIVQQLEGYGLNQTGKQYIGNLINGMLEQVYNGTMEIGPALDNLETAIKTEFQSSNGQQYFNGGKKTAQTAAQNIDKDGLQVIQEAIPHSEKLQANLIGIGTALTSASMAANLITSGLADAGIVSEETSKKVEAITSSLATMGTVMMMAKSAQDMFNISANLNPYIAIASAIIATISLVGTLIKQNAEAEKKANDARIEAANESAEKTKQMEEELASYEELIETYKETGEETDELIERKEELIKLFDLEVYGVNALTSSYEEVAEAMREARIAQLEYDQATQETGLESATNQAYVEGKKPTIGGAGWTGDSTFEIDLGYDSSYETLKEVFEEAAEELEIEGLSYYENQYGNFSISGLPNTPEGRATWLKLIEQVMIKYRQFAPDSTATEGLEEFWSVVSSYSQEANSIMNQSEDTEKALGYEEALNLATKQSVTDIESFGNAVNNIVDNLSEFDLTWEEKVDLAISSLTETQPQLEKLAMVYMQFLKAGFDFTSEEFLNFISSLNGREINLIANLDIVIDENSTIEQVQDELDKAQFEWNAFGDVKLIRNISSYSEKIAAGEMTEQDYKSVYDLLEGVSGTYHGMDAQSYWASITDADRATQLKFLSDVSVQKSEQAQAVRDSLLEDVQREVFTSTSDEYDAYSEAKAKKETGEAFIAEYGTSEEIAGFKTAMENMFNEADNMVKYKQDYESATADAEQSSKDAATSFNKALSTPVDEAALMGGMAISVATAEIFEPATFETIETVSAFAGSAAAVIDNPLGFAKNLYNAYKGIEETEENITEANAAVENYNESATAYQKNRENADDYISKYGGNEITHTEDWYYKNVESIAGLSDEEEAAIIGGIEEKHQEAVTHESNIQAFNDKYYQADGEELTPEAEMYDANIRLFSDEELEEGVTTEEIVKRYNQYKSGLEAVAPFQSMMQLTDGGQLQDFITNFDSTFSKYGLTFNFENLDQIISQLETQDYAELTSVGQPPWLQELYDIQDAKQSIIDAGVEIDWTKEPEEVMEQIQSEIDAIKVEFDMDDSDIENATEKLDALEQYAEDMEEIQIAIDYADIESARAELKQLTLELTNLNNAASLIEPIKYQVDASAYRQIMEMAPEMLRNHKVLSNGMIQLDREVVREYLEGRKTVIQAEIDEATARLENAQKTNGARIAQLQAMAQGERDIETTTARAILTTKLGLTSDEIELSNKAANGAADASAQGATQVIDNYEKVASAIDVLGAMVNDLNQAIANEDPYGNATIDRSALGLEGTYNEIVTDTVTDEEVEEYLADYDTEASKQERKDFERWRQTSKYADAEFGTEEYNEAINAYYNDGEAYVIKDGKVYQVVEGEVSETEDTAATQSYTVLTDLNDQAIEIRKEELGYSADIAEGNAALEAIDKTLDILDNGEPDSSTPDKTKEDTNASLYAEKEAQEDINALKEEESDIDRVLSDLQDDEVKNYPAILALLAKKIQLKKQEIEANKRLLEIEKERMRTLMAQGEEKGFSEYVTYDYENQRMHTNAAAIDADRKNGELTGERYQDFEKWYGEVESTSGNITSTQNSIDDAEFEIDSLQEEMVSTVMEAVGEVVNIIVEVASFISEIAAGIKDALLSALTEQEFWLENTFRRMEALAARQERLLTKNEQIQAGLLSTVGNMEGNYNQRWENLQQQYITAKKIVRDTEDYLTSDLEYAANKMKSAINDAFNGSSGVNVNLGSLSSSKGGLVLPDWIPDKLNPGKWLNLPTIDNLIGSATGLITGILTDSWTTTYKHEDYDGTVGGYLQTNSDLTLAQNLALGLMSNSTLLGPLADTLQTMQDHANETLEAAYDAHEEYTDKMLELEQQMLEMVKEGVEEATAFEDSVMEAYTAQKQAEIDELSRLNDSISNANSALISTLQDNLSKMREERELDKTKEDISDKERRLAYLRQDTSGANKLEILKLEEELEDSRESYTDKLIDKKINELQEQNDKAAEQRQQQIDLLQSQLDYSVKYGLYWNEIYAMLAKDSNFSNGYVAKNSDLAKLLSTYGSTETLSKSIWGTTVAREAFELAGFNYQTFIKRNGLDGSWDLQHVLEAIPKALEEEDKYFTYTDVSGNTVTKTGEGDNDYVFKNKKGQIITDSEIINSLKDAWDRTNLYQSNIASALGVSQQDLDTTTAAALSAAAITASIAQGTADTVAKYLPMILEAVQTGIGFAQTAIQSVIAMIDMFGALSAAFGAVNPFAVGTPFLKQDTLALVHKGEMIIPARYNPENNPNIGLVSKGLLVGESAHTAAAQKNLTTQNNREFSQNVNIIIEEINENVDVDMVIQKITDTLNTNLRYITNI